MVFLCKGSDLITSFLLKSKLNQLSCQLNIYILLLFFDYLPLLRGKSDAQQLNEEKGWIITPAADHNYIGKQVQ